MRQATEKEVRAAATMFHLASAYSRRMIAIWLRDNKRPNREVMINTAMWMTTAEQTFMDIAKKPERTERENIMAMDAIIDHFMKQLLEGELREDD